MEVVDVRVKQIDLPPDVSESVYRRMNAEREKEAREHRSQGQELAEGIRAAADREVTVLKANAYRDAELIRGEGDAEATASMPRPSTRIRSSTRLPAACGPTRTPSRAAAISCCCSRTASSSAT